MSEFPIQIIATASAVAVAHRRHFYSKCIFGIVARVLSVRLVSVSMAQRVARSYWKKREQMYNFVWVNSTKQDKQQNKFH